MSIQLALAHVCCDNDIPGPVEGKDIDGSGVFLVRVAVDARLPS